MTNLKLRHKRQGNTEMVPVVNTFAINQSSKEKEQTSFVPSSLNVDKFNMVYDISSPVSDGGGPIQAVRVKCFPVRRTRVLSALSFFADRRVGSESGWRISKRENDSRNRSYTALATNRVLFFLNEKKTDKLSAADNTRVWREYNTRVQFRPRHRTYAASFEYAHNANSSSPNSTRRATRKLHDPRNVRGACKRLVGNIFDCRLTPASCRRVDGVGEDNCNCRVRNKMDISVLVSDEHFFFFILHGRRTAAARNVVVRTRKRQSRLKPYSR